MCQIDFVTSFICQNCSSMHSHQSLLLLVSMREKEISCQQASSWASHSVPCCRLLSHALSSHPILSSSVCTGSTAGWARGACLSFLFPLHGLHIWVWGSMIHTYKQKRPKQQNPAGSASISCCFPSPQGSQASFLLTQCMQHLHYSPHLGDRECEIRWYVQSHRAHH